MIIVLNSADFSENNIGRVALPREVSDFTKAAILASGNTSLTDIQKTVLDDVFNTLGAITNTGIWPKLTKFYLPIIAQNLSKSLVNYKGNIVDNVPDSAYWAMVNKGLKPSSPSSGVPLGGIITLDESFVADYQDISAFFLSTEGLTPSGSFYSGICRYIGGTNFLAMRLGFTGSGNSYMYGEFPLSNEFPISVDDFYSNADNVKDLSAGKLRGFSSNGTNVIASFGKNLITRSIRSGASSYRDLTPGLLHYSCTAAGTHIYPEQSFVANGAIVIGQSLTNEEIATLKNQLESLYSVMFS